MPLAAFALVVLSAVLHASWNLLMKASSDRLVAAWVQVTAGAVVFAPFLIAGGFPTDRLGSVAASAAIHLGYGLALVAAYERGDLSLVYPIARGVSPLLITAGAALLLDDRPGTLGLAGVVLIAVGLLSVIRRPGPGVWWAVLTGAMITGYTLVDGAAVRAGGESFRYTIAVFAGNALALSLAVLVRRGPAAMRRGFGVDGWRNVAGGVASAIAYMLVLTAARWAPLGLVSAVRETSVVFGALGGWLLLKEPFGITRVRAAVVIAAGLALVAV